MTTTHRRAPCPHCKLVCEQRSTTVFVGGVNVPSLTCIECLTTYADDPRDEPPPETTSNACPLCKSGEVVHRIVRDPSGAELPAIDCVDCEQLCLNVNVATVRAAYAKVAELEEQLRAAETAKQALSQQLLLCERKAASLPPPVEALEEEAEKKLAELVCEVREWANNSSIMHDIEDILAKYEAQP